MKQGKAEFKFHWVSKTAGLETDNAKHLSTKQAAEYFVATPTFERLISAKNHIILGARGSGKTAMVRMLAHDHMAVVKDRAYAEKALRNHLIGIYVPTNIGLLGSLSSKPWDSQLEEERYFQWRMNAHSCASLIPTIRSCIDHYAKSLALRAAAEVDIAASLSKLWIKEQPPARTLDKLLELVQQLESTRVENLNRIRLLELDDKIEPDYFDHELFFPLRRACSVVQHRLEIPNPTWMLCIDEAEYLTLNQHRLLNTHIRTAAGGLVFKIATTPFGHHTLTTNLPGGTPVQEGQDFDYVYIDSDLVQSKGNSDRAIRFARSLISRRLNSELNYSVANPLQDLFGKSLLLEDQDSRDTAKLTEFWGRLKRFGSDETIARARTLKDPRRFGNEIFRKMNGVLLLIEAVEKVKGNSKLSIYSGEAVFVRCTDGNPRRLIRLINQARQVAAEAPSEGHPALTPTQQCDLIQDFARDTLYRIQSEPPVGMQTFALLKTVGNWLANRLHKHPCSTDVVASVEVDESDGPEVQAMVKLAVKLALLIPDQEQTRNGPDAPCVGVFHLAYVLAPHFKLFPRRDRAIHLSSVLLNPEPRPTKPSASPQVKLDFGRSST